MKKDYINMIGVFLLVVLAFFPVFKSALQSIALIIFCLFSIVFHFQNFKIKIKIKKNNVTFLSITGYLLWAILSVFWSTNKNNLINEIQPSLILLIFPIVIIYFYPTITKKLRVIIFISFIISNLILSVYLYNFLELGTARWMSFYKGDTFLYESNSLINKFLYLKEKTFKWSLAYANSMKVSNREFHKAYISSSFLISIALCFFLVLKTKSKLLFKIVLIAIILYLSIWLLYMKSIVNLLACSGFLLFILELKTKKSKLIATFCVLITICLFLNFYKESLKNKIENMYLFQKEYIPMSDEGYIIDYERFNIYRETCALLSKPQLFLFGYGYADCEIELNKKLEKYPRLRNKKWNTHSEFLHFLLGGGIINLLLLLLLLLYIIHKGIKEKNTLLLCFIIIMICNILFENYMSRVMGAYIVAFFICILPENDLKKQL